MTQDGAERGCDDPSCRRPAVVSATYCRVHLAEMLRREGEAILFEDPELSGLHAATIQIVRVALDGLPRDLRTGPMEGIDMYALVDPDAEWALAQASLDLLGTHLSDTSPFGGMRLSPPAAFDSRVLLRLQVL